MLLRYVRFKDEWSLLFNERTGNIRQTFFIAAKKVGSCLPKSIYEYRSSYSIFDHVIGSRSHRFQYLLIMIQRSSLLSYANLSLWLVGTYIINYSITSDRAAKRKFATKIARNQDKCIVYAR